MLDELAHAAGGETSAFEVYPHNVNARNIVHFWLAPTLAYQPLYPWSGKVRGRLQRRMKMIPFLRPVRTVSMVETLRLSLFFQLDDS